MSFTGLLAFLLQVAVPDQSLTASAPPTLAIIDPCPSVSKVMQSSTARDFPFSTLRNEDRSLKPLPGLDRCRIVFSNAVAFVCLGEGLPENASQQDQVTALTAYADSIGQCLPGGEYARATHDDNTIPAISYGAGAKKPFFQFSMTSQLEGTTRLLRPELLVLGPNEEPVRAAPKTKARPKTKASPAKRKTRG